MCRFSEPSRQKLGNTVLYIAQHAKYPYKTEILKLLYLMEELSVRQYNTPFLGIPFSVWRLGPVSVDVFEELSDGPVILGDFITLQFNGQGLRVTPVAGREFNDDEFSDNDITVMEKVMKKYGDMDSEALIALTHKEGSLWYETAKEHGLLQDFEQKRANSSNIVIDMARGLCPDARDMYEETLEIRDFANRMRTP
ncbi:MAG: SocA family protein [Bacteroidales bacterium]|nr:SocA family protein [Bacteroidales bacterium]